MDNRTKFRAVAGAVILIPTVIAVAWFYLVKPAAPESPGRRPYAEIWNEWCNNKPGATIVPTSDRDLCMVDGEVIGARIYSNT